MASNTSQPKVSQVIKVKTTEIGNTRLILLDATNVGYDNLIVKTTHGTVQDMFKDFSETPRSQLQRSCELVKAQITHRNLEELYKTPDEWNDFCNDIMIYYCLRKYLEQEAIPMMPSYAASMVGFTDCILCAQAAGLKCQKCGVKYCSIECQRADWKFHKAECIPFSEQQKYGAEKQIQS